MSVQAPRHRGNWWGAPRTTGVFYFTPVQVVVGVIPAGEDRKHCHLLFSTELHAGKMVTELRIRRQIKQWGCKPELRTGTEPPAKPTARPCPQGPASPRVTALTASSSCFQLIQLKYFIFTFQYISVSASFRAAFSVIGVHFKVKNLPPSVAAGKEINSGSKLPEIASF